MILGGTCTRSCGYCNVTHGTPHAPDEQEPVQGRAAPSTRSGSTTSSSPRSIATTCRISARRSSRATIRETRARIPSCRLEVLIPDFQGSEDALRIVLDAEPDVLNHNIETVPRLYRTARPGGRYPRALDVLRTLAHDRAGDPDEVRPDGRPRRGMGRGRRDAARPARRPACSIVTIGQYLRPSLANLPMSRYYTPASSPSSNASASSSASATSSRGRSCAAPTTRTSNLKTCNRTTAAGSRLPAM